MGYDDDITLNVGMDTGDAQETAESLRDEIQEIFDSFSSKEVSDSMREIMSSADETAKRYREISAEMEELGKTPIFAEEHKKVEEEFIAVQKEIDKTEQKIASVTARMEKLRTIGSDKGLTLLEIKGTDRYKSLQYDYEKLQETVDSLIQKQVDLNNLLKIMPVSGENAPMGSSTQRYANMSAELDELMAKLQDLRNQAAEELPDPDPTPSRWDLLKERIGNASKAVLGFLRNLQRVIGEKIKSGIEKLGKSIAGLGKHTKSANGGLSVGFKKLLRYGLGVRSLFALINKLRRALIEGLNAMAQSYAPFGEVMQQFKNSLTTLRNSFASAFAPVLQQVLPILTQLILRLADGVSMIGRFIAALQGKSVFIQAQRVQKSYASSLGNTAKAAREARLELMGFDEIQKLSDNSSADGGNGSGDNGEGTFTKSPITGKIKEIADTLRKLIQDENWERLGEYLASGINSIFDKANQFLTAESLYEKIDKWATAITTTFNSLVSNINWNKIGETIGNGVNFIVYSLNSLIDKVNFQEIGKQLASGLNGLISTIKWEDIGHLFAQRLNILINTLYGFVKEFKWKDAAKEMTAGLNRFIQDIDWKKAGQAISGALRGALQFLITAVKEFDWKELGKNVADFILNIDWLGILSDLGELFIEIIVGIGELIGGFCVELWEGIKQWWEDNKDNIKEFGKNIWNGICEGIKEGLSKIGSWLKTNVWEPFIKGVKNIFGISSPAKNMKPYGKYIAQGLLDGIKGGLQNIGSWIKTNIFTPIKNGIATAFQVAGHVANTVLDIGRSIIGGIQNGISTAVSSASSWIRTNVFTPINNGIRTAFQVAGNVANSVVDIGRSIIGGIQNGISGTWNSVTRFFQSSVGQIRSILSGQSWVSIGTNICAGIRNGLSSGWSYVTTAVSRLAYSAYNTVKRVLRIGSPSKLFRDDIGKMIPAGMGEGILEDTDVAVKAVQKLTDAVTDSAVSSVKLPSVVGGNVIPYATSLAINSHDDDNNTTTTDLYTIISDAIMYALANSDGFKNEVTLEGDVGKLFRLIRQQGLDYQQATGNPVFG